MAFPSIKIDQSPLAPGAGGSSRSDLVLGVPVYPTDVANGAGVYTWELVVPPGSAAVLAGANTATPSFTPDVRGTYLIYVQFDADKSWTENADGLKVSTQGGAAVKHRLGTRALGVGETFQFASANGWAEDFHPYFSAIDSIRAIEGSAHGSLFYSSSDGDAAVLAPGDAGDLLLSGGPAAAPSWIASALFATVAALGAHSLDAAYDAGRTIAADAGAVAISNPTANAQNVLELTTTALGTGAALAIANLGAGPAISVSPDTDQSFVLGRARIDSRQTDQIAFSHYDQVGIAAYAIRQLSDGRTFLNSPSSVGLEINGASRFHYDAAILRSITAGGPGMRNVATTATVPVFVTNYSDLTTGVGGAAGTLSLITGGVEALRVDASQNLVASEAIYPAFNLAKNLGSTSRYWLNTYSARYWLSEVAAASAFVAGKGQIWVKSDAPSTFWYTDDTGVDWQVGGAGAHPDPHLLGDGSAAAPTYAFASEATGLYRFANTLGFSVAGALRWRMQTNYLRAEVAGSAGSPNISLAADSNSGLVLLGSDEIAISTGGVEAVRWDTNQHQHNAGHIYLGLNQRLVLDDDGDTYLYCVIDDLMRFYVGGVNTLTFSSSAFTSHTITQVERNALGAVSSSTVDGLRVMNSTDAALGAQQYSPVLLLRGEGWATTPSTSQPVEARFQVIPTQGAAAPTHDLVVTSGINGIFSEMMRVSSAGAITAAADTDTAFVFGRARIDSRVADTACFSHYDLAGATQYALSATSSGITNINGTSSIRICLNSITSWYFDGSNFRTSASDRFAILNEVTTRTNPVFAPHFGSASTGLGGVAGEVSLITGGVEALRVDASQNTLLWGSLAVVGTVEAAPNVDSNHILGRARIDSRITDLAYFSHYDQAASTGYALMQSAAGQTNINTPAGQTMYFNIGNGLQFNISAANGFSGQNANGPALLNEAATNINPTLIPDRASLNSGVSNGGTTGQVSIVTGGVLAVRWDASQHQFNAANITATGDLDAAGGFRRVIERYLTTPAANSTYTMKRDGTLAGNDALGWFVPARNGSLVELSVWADGDVPSGTIGFWVQVSTDGGDTFTDAWGTSAAPILELDSVSNPEVNAAAQAKGTTTVNAGNVLRIRAVTSGFSVGVPRLVSAALGFEC